MTRYYKRTVPKKAIKNALSMLLSQTNNVECKKCKRTQHKRHENCKFCGEIINKK